MGIHFAAAALHISSSFDQRHAELAPPRSAYPPSLPLHPFSPSPGASLAQPTLLSAANYGVAPPKLGDEGRGGLPIIPFSLLPSSMSFVPVLITLHPNFPSRRFPLSLPPFSSSSCAVEQQQASISSAQLAELDRSRTVLFTTRNSPSLFSTHLSSSATDTSIAICRSRLSAR